MENYTFRLKSGQDLFDAIQEFVNIKNIQAGCVISAVGSLTQVALRFANRDSYSEIEGFFEIVSITGTISVHGSHLHLSVAGADGRTIGGHLGLGCNIYTTAEIAILVFENEVYTREFAEDSGYEELMIHKT